MDRLVVKRCQSMNMGSCYRRRQRSIRSPAALGVKSAQLLSGSPYYSERRQFLKLPKDERDRILSEQAKEMVDFYENDTEWREWSVGPIIKYDVP